MDVNEIEKILTDEVAAILAADTGAIATDVPLGTLGIDSLGFVELLVAIEKKFDLKLMESGLSTEDFKTINSLANCISRGKGE